MVLMPQDAVLPSREQIEQTRSVQTPGTTLTRLDAEMDEILRSVTPSNQREKWKMYQQVLQRYQFFSDEERHPKNITTPATSEKPDDIAPVAREKPQTAEKASGMSDAAILSTVPKTYKKQAEQLLKHLHSSSNNRLSWDQTGLVRINNEPIKGSSITDLVNDAMRNRKTVRATGREQFGAELRRLGIPREFIGNTSLLYENLSLDAAINSNLSGLDASVSSNIIHTPNTSLNSSGSSGRRRIPTSQLLNSSWKKLKI